MTDTLPADASAAHRLPYTLTPVRYDLHLAPDLEAATFTGKVSIEAEVHEAVSEIVLNAAELTIGSVTVEAGGTTLAATATSDEETERVTLALDGELPPGPCRIHLDFAGILNDHLHGFYRSTFTDTEGATRTIATTQFEATDARRAFPCFDEPDRKAVFAVTLDVPAGLAAYSNGPQTGEEPIEGGARRVTFGETIPMSTYLVAFVVGPLEATDPVDVDGTAVRVVHVPGKDGLTDFAVDCAAHALRFFTDWFGIPYPAEKLDLVAIPDFAFGAMENLGCVTFRETALLVDPARSSRLEQERVADVISHEIAHMWFGDLVTMKWWTGIWLNEAFATLMELLCVDHYRPDWQRWVSFGMERDVAMATDSLHRTRPVEYPVGPPEEAQGMFDVLTYQKGASVLRMLERYLGPEAFRAGIRRYLDTHRYGNTETSDLWDAIEAASGEPVRDIMDTWILQGGFPLVHAETPEDDPDHDADGSGSDSGAVLELTQEPFTLGPPDGESAIGSHWRIPVLARSLASEGETKVLLDRAALVDLGSGPVVVNAGGAGFFRVAYSADHLRHLATALDRLDPLERFNLLGDTWTAFIAERADLADFLVLVEGLGNEGDPNVWAQATGALGFLDRAVDDDALEALAGYTRALLRPVHDRLGWEAAPGEGERTATLRAQVLGALGTVGQDEAVRFEAASRHAAALEGTAPLDPDLASAVVGIVASAGSEAEYEAFLDRYRHPATPQEEMRYLTALAAFGDPGLAARTFDLAVGEVRSQNAPFLVQALLTNRTNGPAAWDRVVDHWDTLVDRTPANILPRMLDGVKLLCRHPALAAAVAAFVADHPLPTGQRTVDQAVERLFVNVGVAGRLRPSVADDLTAGVDRLSWG